MRWVGILLLALLCLPAADAATSVVFGTPAQFSGDIVAHDASWLLLVFPGTDWSANATLEGETLLDASQYTAYYRPRLMGPPSRFYAVWAEPEEHDLPGTEVRMGPTEPWGSLFVRADAIRVSGTESTMSLQNGPGAVDPSRSWFPTEVPHHAFRSQQLEPDQPFLMNTDLAASAVEVHAEGLREVEARGFSATCGGASCAHSELRDTEGLVKETTSWRWFSEGGVLSVSGKDAIVVAGGVGMGVTASGSVRLPDLRTSLATLDQLGVSVEGQTLRGQGDLSILDLRTRADHTARGSLSTDLAAARLDESPLLMQATASVSAVATVTLVGLVLWKGKAVVSFLGGLFTRMDMDAALAHPNRRALFDYVDENPGTTFRELIGSTGMAAGTARHHIAVLTRSGVLIERPFGQTLRYFHCEQAQVGDWDAVVVLRQPDLDRMYRWLLDNPDVMQREILDAAESWGWRRSTAQHRLKRLVDNQLAHVRDLGRSKSYRARVVDIR